MPEMPEVLSKSLGELASVVLSPSDLDTTLQRVAHLAQGMAKDCHGVGVTLLVSGELTTVACTAETIREIDNAQYEAGSGPCLDALDQLQVFHVPSLHDESSWPEFRAAAIERSMSSSLSLPLTFGSLSLGTLNLYSSEPHAFDECGELALVFAAQAGVAVGSALLRRASQEVLQDVGELEDSGDVVDQARDILVEQEGFTREEALEILRSKARTAHGTSRPRG